MRVKSISAVTNMHGRDGTFVLYVDQSLASRPASQVTPRDFISSSYLDNALDFEAIFQEISDDCWCKRFYGDVLDSRCIEI